MVRIACSLTLSIGLVAGYALALTADESGNQQQSLQDNERASEPAPTLEEDLAALAAVVQRIKKDPSSAGSPPGAPLVMRLARNHWDDPEVEKALQAVAKSGPARLGPRGAFSVPTYAGAARGALRIVAAKKEQAVLLSDAETPDEKLRRIQTLFEEHPDWLDRRKRSSENLLLPGELLTTAQATAGAKAMRLSVQADFLSVKYAASHSEAFIEALRDLTPSELAKRTRVRGALRDEKLKAAIPLLRDYASKAESREDIRALLSTLAVCPNAQAELIKLLEDRRPDIVLNAASFLSGFYPNEKSSAAIEGAIKRSVSRTRAGEKRIVSPPGNPSEADRLEYVLRNIQEQQAEKSK